MARTRLFLCLFIFGCISASAQQQPLPGNIIPAGRIAPLPQIGTYLALTDDQVTRLIQNLTDYSQLVSQRQQRMFQVQSEIRDETAKSPLDPAALGIRYAEIETICRNVRDEGAAAQTRNLTLLTDAQKVKLKALDDAYKLLPVINEAQNAGLLSPPAPYAGVLGFITGRLGVSSFPLGPASANLSGCQQPAIPIAAIPNGDFTGAP